MCECPALARVHLDTIQGHQLIRQPLDLYRLVRLTKVDLIGKAMERRAEQVKFTGGLATPGLKNEEEEKQSWPGFPSFFQFFVLFSLWSARVS